MSASSNKTSATLVVLGKFGAPFGVKGWVKVHSSTDPAENLFYYKNLQLQNNAGLSELKFSDWRPHGDTFVVQVADCDDRNQAQLLTNSLIVVDKQQLPHLEPGEYYWAELEGMVVKNTKNKKLGIVDYLFETGANDVMVVKGSNKELLIPYVKDTIVKEVNAAENYLVVDWDEDY